MDIERLHKEDFRDPFKGEPTIRFSYNGEVYINQEAVKHLKIDTAGVLSPVHICRDPKHHSDFSIVRGNDGWELKKVSRGGVRFNNVGLARHVIDTTWDRCQSHPVGAVKPLSVLFRIARLPIDDDKNKDVFALLRKKE